MTTSRTKKRENTHALEESQHGERERERERERLEGRDRILRWYRLIASNAKKDGAEMTRDAQA